MAKFEIVQQPTVGTGRRVISLDQAEVEKLLRGEEVMLPTLDTMGNQVSVMTDPRVVVMFPDIVQFGVRAPK